MHELKWAMIGTLITVLIHEISEVIERRKNKKSFMPPVKVPAPPVAEPPRQTPPPVAMRTPADIDRDYIRHQRSVDDLLDRWCKAYFAIDKSRSLIERLENEKKEKQLSEELKMERKAVETLIEEFKEATKRVESS